MVSLWVVNQAGDVLANNVTAASYMAFKQKTGQGSAIVVELDCGEEIFVDTVKLLKRLPHDAVYRARLLRKTKSPPEDFEHAGYTVWEAV